MVDFKQERNLNVELGDTAYSSTEDMLLRKTCKLVKNKPVSEIIEYSSTLEAFIRQIVNEELKKALDVMRGRLP